MCVAVHSSVRSACGVLCVSWSGVHVYVRVEFPYFEGCSIASLFIFALGSGFSGSCLLPAVDQKLLCAAILLLLPTTPSSSSSSSELRPV